MVSSGTGKAAQIPGIEVCAKTGTAQVVQASAGKNTYSLEKGERDHAWFAGFAPRNNPTVAFVVMVEHGGHGGDVGAKIAKAGLEYLFLGKKPGEEVGPPRPSTVQTRPVETRRSQRTCPPKRRRPPNSPCPMASRKRCRRNPAVPREPTHEDPAQGLFSLRRPRDDGPASRLPRRGRADGQLGHLRDKIRGARAAPDGMVLCGRRRLPARDPHPLRHLARIQLRPLWFLPAAAPWGIDLRPRRRRFPLMDRPRARGIPAFRAGQGRRGLGGSGVHPGSVPQGDRRQRILRAVWNHRPPGLPHPRGARFRHVHDLPPHDSRGLLPQQAGALPDPEVGGRRRRRPGPPPRPGLVHLLQALPKGANPHLRQSQHRNEGRGVSGPPGPHRGWIGGDRRGRACIRAPRTG